MIDSGMSSFSRWMCSAIGLSLSSAKRRNVSCTISKSASRWRGPSPSIEARKAGRPVGGEELAGAVEHARLDAPLGLAPEHLGARSWTASATKAQVICASSSPLPP